MAGKKATAEQQPEGTAELAERLGLIATGAQLSAGTLAGDLRDTMLDLFKSRPKPWSQMLEGEQNDVARAIEYAARELVMGAVAAIRADGQESPVKAILEGYSDKGTITATLKVKTMDEDGASLAVAQLHRARGKLVLVTIASADDYLGERGEVEIPADQGGLSFESGTDAEPPPPEDEGEQAQDQEQVSEDA